MINFYPKIGALREKWTSSTAMLHCKILILMCKIYKILSSYFGYFHISNESPGIRQTAKFYTKNKNVSTFDKSYCDSWNKHLQVCQKYIFNQSSEFWNIIFGPGQDPGQLY